MIAFITGPVVLIAVVVFATRNIPSLKAVKILVTSAATHLNPVIKVMASYTLTKTPIGRSVPNAVTRSMRNYMCSLPIAMKPVISASISAMLQ